MTIELSILISVVSVSFAIFFGLKSARRVDEAAIEKRAKETQQILSSLDEISRDIKSIKNDIDKSDEQIKDHGERILMLENGVKYTNDRFNTIENRMAVIEAKNGL